MNFLTENFGGTSLHLYGWGASNANQEHTTTLQSVDVQGLSLEDCKALKKSTVDSSIVCVASIGRGACNGDSGGKI